MKLDNRPALYGEPRLSNAQVKCLRSISAGAFNWDNHSVLTVRALAHRHHALDVTGGVYPFVSETGRKLLADIDASAGRAAP